MSAPASRPRAQPGVQAASPSATARPIEVLVAEDSPTSRDLLVHLLEADGGMRVGRLLAPLPARGVAGAGAD